jgi:hypothetical protein
VRNGTFSAGLNDWQLFSDPASSLFAAVNNGVLEFYRLPGAANASNQAAVKQSLGVPLPANSPVAVEFDISNSSRVRKRLTMMIHDADFSDLQTCEFWLEPFAPARRYSMRTHSDRRAWKNLTVSFYASSEGSEGGTYRLDNVVVSMNSAQAVDRTDCVDPTVSVTGQSGADGPNVIANGSFSKRLASWELFGQIKGSVSFIQGSLQFARTAGTPAGAVLQRTGVAFPIGTRLTATLRIGNTSKVRKRITAVLHDADFQDLEACTFWTEPGQKLTPYTMRVVTRRAWANTTISFYLSENETQPSAVLDDVTLQQTPSAAMLGTECINVNAPRSPGLGRASGALSSTTSATGASATESASQITVARISRTPVPVVNDVASQAAEATGIGAVAFDLRSSGAARLAFSSLFLSGRAGDRGSGQVQVSLDGVSWTTVGEIPSGSRDWDAVDVGLDEFAGHVVFVRFVSTPGDGEAPAVWWLANLRIE